MLRPSRRDGPALGVFHLATACCYSSCDPTLRGHPTRTVVGAARPAMNETTMTRSMPDAAPMPLTELAAVADLFTSTTIDGIPVILAPGRDPRVTAGLAFRVGWADETLPTRGITHLVEHLALYGLGEVDAHHNGTTRETITEFHITGTEAEVVAFLNGLCRALRDLPVERLQVEKDVLWTEGAQRATGWAAPSAHRYGASGPGLGAFEELGLHGIDADAVRSWAASRFTRRNAVLWVVGDRIPEGLDLALDEGSREPVPVWTEIVHTKPAWYAYEANELLLNSEVGNRESVGLFAAVASKMLNRALRRESGYSYSANCDWHGIDADRARVIVHADARPETRQAMVHGVLEVLEDIRAGKVDDADLAALKATLVPAADLPDLAASIAPSAAARLLAGLPIRHPDAVRSELLSVTTADLAAIAADVLSDAVVQVPRGCTGLEEHGFSLIVDAPVVVEGTVHRFRADPKSAVIIGEKSVSVRMPDGVITVEYDRCAALLMVPDGARMLQGHNGWRVTIEPNELHRVTPEVIAKIDRSVSADRHVPLPAREPSEIPVRSNPALAVLRAFILPSVIVLGVLLVCILDLAGILTPERSLTRTLLPIMLPAVFVAGVGSFIVARMRRPRR